MAYLERLTSLATHPVELGVEVEGAALLIPQHQPAGIRAVCVNLEGGWSTPPSDSQAQGSQRDVVAGPKSEAVSRV